MSEANPYTAPGAELSGAQGESYSLKIISFHGRIGRLRYLAYGIGANFLLMAVMIPLVGASAFMGAGLMDRFPGLHFAILESGFGWLPFWMKRMEDQIVYMGYVAEDLQHTMTEYMTDGRFYAAAILHEGPDMVRMVSELMGDHVLMFSSDYPHAESRFPHSVDMAVGWENLTREYKQKFFWDNAARCFNLS